MTPDCIDLEEQFGDRYRVVHEDGKRPRQRDPWRMVVACRHGHIYPHGGKMLGAGTRGRGAVANRLAALRCTTVMQDGTDGINAIFHIKDFAKVATILKPRRRRTLSPTQITERTERLKNYRFSPASRSDFGAHSRDPTTTPTKTTASV